MKLRCKHQCIGLCGEKCPSVCRICDPDHETFQILFGNEEEPDSRFVELDCGHAFEMKDLDRWMNQKSDAAAVKYKECPKCKTPIMKCKRYMQQINQVLNDINNIKRRIL